MAAPWQVSGTTDIAPHSPVADWRCVAEGEGYGNYYDPISQQYATVTRATPKTARTADGRIVDVPAGKLALEPWSLHKEGGVGHAAIIEEARTNYLVNSYGAANNGTTWDSNWTFQELAHPATKSIVDGVYGATAQRMEYAPVGGETKSRCLLLSTMPLYGSFLPADSAVGSAWVKAALVGCTVRVTLLVLDSSSTFLGASYGTSIAGAEDWTRISTLFASLPANASTCQSRVDVMDVTVGDSFDITIDACQLEKGSFPTSYIPTTTAAVTRNADVVRTPVYEIGSQATIHGVAAGRGSATTQCTIFSWRADIDNRATLSRYMINQATIAGNGVVKTAKCDEPDKFSPATLALRYADGASAHAYMNGVPGDGVQPITAPIGASKFTIGSYIGAHSFANDAAIARLTVYDKALTDEQLAAADMTTDLLAGIEGVAAPALAADWRVVPIGLGYGNYYDSVTKQWATVMRSTPKTAQIAPNRIVDVPAGQLAVVPWSLHKAGGTGYAAVIEEARTNYLVNSYGAANNGRLWSSWTSAGSLFYVLDQEMVDGLYGPSAQRLKYESPPEGDALFGNFSQVSGVGSFLAGEKAISSFYMRGDTENAKIQVQTSSFAADGVTLLGYVVANATPTSDWQRFMIAYSGLPANTSRARALVSYSRSIGGSGYSFDLTIDAVQLEKGAFATSYIPTTTAAATRNADVVAVPTTGWSASKGTMVGVVAHDWSANSALGLRMLATVSGTVGNAHLSLYRSSGSANYMIAECAGDSLAAAYPSATNASTGGAARIAALTWAGTATRVALDGVVGSERLMGAAISAFVATANVGRYTSSALYANGPIARLTVYATALTDAQIQSAELTTELLKGLDTSKLTKEMILDETRASYSAVYISG